MITPRPIDEADDDADLPESVLDAAESRDSGDVRALGELTKDLRLAQPTDVDSARIERELFAKIDRESPRPIATVHRLPGRGSMVLGLIAAAAGALLFLRGTMTKVDVEPQVEKPVAVAPTSAPQLIETGDSARRFQHDGLATWTIAPHSKASVTEGSELVTVALSEGAIEVDVIPQPVAERFVVLVDHTRVAVHGTSFRVARTAAGVDVDVAHGTVAVGPIDGVKDSPRWLLPGPVGGSFSLGGTDGTLRTLRAFGPAAPAITPPASDAVGTQSPKPVVIKSTATRTPDAASAVVPGTLSAVSLGARAQDAAASCFEKNARLSPGVHFTVSTTLTLLADAQGALISVFDPPLAPPVESCFRDAMSSSRATAGSYEITLRLADQR